MKISDIGEGELIKKIGNKIKLKSKDVIKGIGDDAAVLKYNDKFFMLFSTDSLVEGDHFDLKWFKPEQIGKKAIESNVSDIAAMGGFPKYALISLTLPKNIDYSFIEKLYNGINTTSKKYKIDIIGGNLARSDKIIITISIVGLVEKKNLCLRSDAKINDLICVTGNLGKSRAGLELLRKKVKGNSINYYLNPKSRLNLSKKLVSIGINAMEDVSDGLGAEIKNICNESRKGAIIYRDLIPINKETIKDARKLKNNPYAFALYGGEDYELVFTVNKNKLKKLKNKKIDFTVVGKILDKRKGIYLLDMNKKYKLKYGYDHFRDS